MRDAKAPSFERAGGFDSVQQAITKKLFPKDDADWIRAGLDALAGKKGKTGLPPHFHRASRASARSVQ